MPDFSYAPLELLFPSSQTSIAYCRHVVLVSSLRALPDARALVRQRHSVGVWDLGDSSSPSDAPRLLIPPALRIALEQDESVDIIAVTKGHGFEGVPAALDASTFITILAIRFQLQWRGRSLVEVIRRQSSARLSDPAASPFDPATTLSAPPPRRAPRILAGMSIPSLHIPPASILDDLAAYSRSRVGPRLSHYKRCLNFQISQLSERSGLAEFAAETALISSSPR
ncbi:hypothetical protein FB107DRAFT_271769 [Schizophyllum commune]